MPLSFQDKIKPVANDKPATGEGLSFADKIKPVGGDQPVEKSSVVGKAEKLAKNVYQNLNKGVVGGVKETFIKGVDKLSETKLFAEAGEYIATPEEKRKYQSDTINKKTGIEDTTNKLSVLQKEVEALPETFDSQKEVDKANAKIKEYNFLLEKYNKDSEKYNSLIEKGTPQTFGSLVGETVFGGAKSVTDIITNKLSNTRFFLEAGEGLELIEKGEAQGTTLDFLAEELTGNLSEMSKSFSGRGTANIIDTMIASPLNFATRATYGKSNALGDFITDFAGEMRDQFTTEKSQNITEQQFSLDKVKSPDFWITTVAENIPVTLAFMKSAQVSMNATGKLTNLFGKSKFAQIAGQVVQVGVGGTTMRAFESSAEAEETYKSAKADGMSEQEALNASIQVFQDNMKLVGLDALQVALAFAKLPKGVKVPDGVIPKILAEIVKLAGGATSEGFEEVFQYGAQQRALGKTDLSSMELLLTDPHAQEAGFIGAVMGVAFQVGGRVDQYEQDKARGKYLDDVASELGIDFSEAWQKLKTNDEKQVLLDRYAEIEEKNTKDAIIAIEEKNKQSVEATKEAMDTARKTITEVNRAKNMLENGSSNTEAILTLSDTLGVDTATEIVNRIAPEVEAKMTKEVTTVDDTILDKNPAEIQTDFDATQNKIEEGLADLRNEVEEIKKRLNEAPDRSALKKQTKIELSKAQAKLNKAEENFNNTLVDKANELRTSIEDYIKKTFSNLSLSEVEKDNLIDDIIIQTTDTKALARTFTLPLKTIVDREVARIQKTEPKVEKGSIEDLEAQKEAILKQPQTEFTKNAIKQLDKKIAKLKKPKTQKEKVKKVVKEKGKASIKEIAEETGILEPNIRRILGVGAKEGEFERVADGVYTIKNAQGQDVAVIIPADAVETLPKLAKEGFKADMVFLDIPYDTPAVKGGNRGVNYNLISVEDFGKVLDATKEILRDENAPIIHFFSQAPSGMKKMQKYNDLFVEKKLIPLGRGEYQKTFKDGSPVTSPNGKVAKPEGIIVFNQSGVFDKTLDLQFKMVRPKGYQTEKPAEMIKKLIKMTTKEGDTILDPFAGSGVVPAEAVKSGRKAVAIEKNKEVAKDITKKRVEEAVTETEKKAITKDKNGVKNKQRIVEAKKAPVKEVAIKREKITQIGEKVIRNVPEKRIYNKDMTILKGTYNGKPYTTNSFIMEFVDLKGITPTEGRNVPTSDQVQTVIIDNLKDAKPLGEIKHFIKAQGVNGVFFEIADGGEIGLDVQYYNHFLKKFPDMELRGTTDKSPVGVYSKGELVGVIMPLNPDRRGTFEKIPVEKEGNVNYTLVAKELHEDAFGGSDENYYNLVENAEQLGLNVEAGETEGAVLSLQKKKKETMTMKEAGDMFSGLLNEYAKITGADYSITPNKDGSLTAYHGTNKKASKTIKKEGFNSQVYLSPEEGAVAGGVGGALEYGTEIFEVTFDPRYMEINGLGEIKINDIDKIISYKQISSGTSSNTSSNKKPKVKKSVQPDITPALKKQAQNEEMLKVMTGEDGKGAQIYKKTGQDEGGNLYEPFIDYVFDSEKDATEYLDELLERGDVLKTLEQKAQSKSEEDFVSSSIFENSITKEEEKALQAFEGDTTADKLSSFYKTVTKSEDIADDFKVPQEEVAPVDQTAKNEDVGEKIGGAQKDLYTKQSKGYEQEYSVEELRNLTLSKILPPLDYKNLIENKVPAFLVQSYIYNKTRLGRRPNKRSYKLEGWFRQVMLLRQIGQYMFANDIAKALDGIYMTVGRGTNAKNILLKDVASEVPEIGLTYDLYEKYDYLNDDYITKFAVRDILGGEMNGKPVTRYYVTRDGKYFMSTQADSVADFLQEFDKKFKEDKERRSGKKKKESVFADKVGVYQMRSGGDYIVMYKNGQRSFTLDTYNTLQEAREARQNPENMARWEEMFNLATGFDKNSFRDKEAPTVGKRTYRTGDVSAEEFMQTFGFRGVEFGNWLNQEDRRVRLNAVYDSFKDLAKILGVPDNALSLNGELGFAFGSRGKKGASAHYEPDRVVINITKESGAGTIAHEWWHSLDNYLSRRSGNRTGYVTDLTNVYERKELNDAIKAMVKTIVSSDIYKRSAKADRYKGRRYYTNKTELGARAFEIYVREKLAEQNLKNGYLVQVPAIDSLEDSPYRDVHPYAVGEEVPVVVEAVDTVIKTLEQKEEDGRTVLFKLKGSNLTSELLGLQKDTISRDSLLDFAKNQKLSKKETDTLVQKFEEYIDQQELSQTLRGTKGLTAEDITKTYPNIKLTRDVPAKDIYGNKVIIPDGEKLTPYELKGNKILLQDGETYVVSKSQFQNIENQSIKAEGKPFAPELEGLEETVLGVGSRGSKADAMRVISENGYSLEEDMFELFITKGDEDVEYDELPLNVQRAVDTVVGNAETKSEVNYGEATKYSQYQLPNGKNYREILIRAPLEKKDIIATKNTSSVLSDNLYFLTDNQGNKLGSFNAISKTDAIEQYQRQQGFKSSHWTDFLNVIFHLRLNDRIYKGKKVTFMEEAQSDWAREYRKATDEVAKERAIYERDLRLLETESNVANREAKIDALKEKLEDMKSDIPAIPNNSNLKIWTELSVKRGLKEAVNTNSEYFAWINGEQTSARYDLSTQVENVKWTKRPVGNPKDKSIQIFPKEGSQINIIVDEKGIINSTKADLNGKQLDEVLGKGLADKIMEKESGSLSGEGLRFGGEWASNLYDKQVRSIVKSLTGAEIEIIDLGLPVENVKREWVYGTGQGLETLVPEKIKVGLELRSRGSAGDSDNWIITDVLGEGKFKAIMKENASRGSIAEAKLLQGDASSFKYMEHLKETFDISVETTTQQAIRLTPEIKARIRGEAPKIETSRNMFETDPEFPVGGFVDFLKRELPELSTKRKETERNDTESADIISAKDFLSDFKKRLKLDFDVIFVDNILADKKINPFTKEVVGRVEAYGVTADNTIALVREMAKYTAEHEVVHLTLQHLNTMPIFERQGITREKVLQGQADKMGVELNAKTRGRVEEQLALDFEQYVDGKHKAKGIIRNFFILLKRALTKFAEAIGATKGDIVTNYFDVLLEGSELNEQIVRLENKGILESYIEDDILDVDEIDAVLRNRIKPMEAVRANKIADQIEATEDRQERIKILNELSDQEVQALAVSNAGNRIWNSLENDFAVILDYAMRDVKEDFKFKLREENDKYLQKVKSQYNDLIKETEKLENDTKAWKADIDKELIRSEQVAELVEQTPEEVKALARFTKRTPPKGTLTDRGIVEVEKTEFENKEQAEERIGAYLKRKAELVQVRNKLRTLRRDIANAKKEGKNNARALRDIERRIKLRKQLLERKDYYVTMGLERGKKSQMKMIRRRGRAVRDAQDFFMVSDKKAKDIIGGRKIHLMGEEEFNDFLIEFSNRAQDLRTKLDAQEEVNAIIQEKQYGKWENLLKAMGLPSLSKMSEEQANRFVEALSKYQFGDVFLTARQLETIHRTQWGDIKTERELLSKMKEHTGTGREEMKTLTAPENGGYYTSWIRLARSHPFYNWLVGKRVEASIKAEREYIAIEEEVNKLVSNARRSRRKQLSLKGKLVELLVPTDEVVFAYIESDNKPEFAEKNKMTPEELELSDYLITLYKGAYDYMSHEYGMSGRKDYMTHTRRSFFEALKESGAKSALREILTSQREEEASFKILDEETGNTLAFEKFFGFAIRRTGGLVPSKNVARASLAYFRAFAKKKAIDEFVPEALIAVQAHKAIVGTTEKGLTKDPTFEKFVKRFINDAKGRKVWFGTKQGSQSDIAIRAMTAWITVKYLGLNVATATANFIGDFTAIAWELSLKEVGRGALRSLDLPKVHEVNKRFRFFSGRNPFAELFDPQYNVPSRLLKAIMVLMSLASFQSNKFFLRAKMTDKEWQTMLIEDTRLKEVALSLSRVKPNQFYVRSLAGNTSVGGSAFQFGTWAIAIFNSVTSDAVEVGKIFNKRGTIEAITSNEAKKIAKFAILATLAYAIVSAIEPPDDDDDSFFAQVMRKAHRELTTLTQAIQFVTNPSSYFLIVKELSDWYKLVSQTISQEIYKTDGVGYGIGDPKWTRTGARLITPTALKHFFPQERENTKMRLLDEAVETGEFDPETIAERTNPDDWNNTKGERDEKEQEEYRKKKVGELTRVYNLKKNYPESVVGQIIVDESKNDDRIEKMFEYGNEVGVDTVYTELKTLYKDRNLCIDTKKKTGCLVSDQLFKEFRRLKNKQ